MSYTGRTPIGGGYFSVYTGKAPSAALTTDDISDDAITSAKIATGAVGSDALAATGTPTGTFGSGSYIPVITVDADGRITNISNTSVSATVSVNTDDIANGAITSAKIADDAITSAKIATGAVGSDALAATGTPTGTFGSGSLVPVITVDADGRITNISNTSVVTAGGLFTEGVTGVWSTSSITSATVDGDFIVTGDITSNSDERLKDNVETIQSALSKVLDLRGVEFDKNGTRHIGLIAQEVERVIPEVVATSSDEMETKSVAYGNIVGLLIEAIKEQNEKIKILENKLENK